MRFMKPSLALSLLVFAAVPAKAGILIEPYVSYEMNTIQTTYGGAYYGGASVKTEASGAGFGARLAYTVPFFFAGLDYSTANTTSKIKDDPTGEALANSGTRSTLYAILGVKVPLVRAYAGYGFLNDYTDKDPTGDATLKGTATKIGVSYTGLPFVALNFEYIQSNYTKMKDITGEWDLASDQLLKEAKNTAYLLSLSVPFEF